MNFYELIGAKSAPIVLYMSLAYLKNFLEVELFKVGDNLSFLRIAMILSCLPESIKLESICVFLSLGKRLAMFLVLAFFAKVLAFLSSFSSIPAPLNKASLCCLFSSSCAKNSC